MLRITEVDMVDSVDDLTSWRSIEGTEFQNFEMLDAQIASSLEQKAQKEDRFLRGRQIAHMIYDNLFSYSWYNRPIWTHDAQWGVKHALEFTVVDRAKRRKAMMEIGACVSLLEKCHSLG